MSWRIRVHWRDEAISLMPPMAFVECLATLDKIAFRRDLATSVDILPDNEMLAPRLAWHHDLSDSENKSLLAQMRGVA